MSLVNPTEEAGIWWVSKLACCYSGTSQLRFSEKIDSSAVKNLKKVSFPFRKLGKQKQDFKKNILLIFFKIKKKITEIRSNSYTLFFGTPD